MHDRFELLRILFDDHFSPWNQLNQGLHVLMPPEVATPYLLCAFHVLLTEARTTCGPRSRPMCLMCTHYVLTACLLCCPQVASFASARSQAALKALLKLQATARVGQ